jgi:glyoxylase-like metal-dependent hydrolase (beta-lactamase superfamily II)
VIHNFKEALVVDPGGDPAKVINFLKKNNLTLKYILNTHFHFDHILGNKDLQDATGAEILASNKDEFLLKAQVGGGGGMFGFPKVPPFTYRNIAEGVVEWLDEECRILSTPGHTPGSLSFYFPQSNALFSGDLIFQRSIGRTDFPGGSLEELLKSVREKVFILPGETVIYSGHGPATTVHEERLFNPFFQEGAMF